MGSGAAVLLAAGTTIATWSTVLTAGQWIEHPFYTYVRHLLQDTNPLSNRLPHVPALLMCAIALASWR